VTQNHGFDMEAAFMNGVERTVAIFEMFADEGQAMSLTDIARTMQLPMSTCFNLLKSLQAGGYLYEVASKSYYPTGRLAQISSRISERDPSKERIAPQMRVLRDQCGETVLLTKMIRGKIMLLEVEHGKLPIRYTPRVGDFRAVHTTASGKALLSVLPDAQIHDFLAKAKLERLTDRTITNAGALSSEIRTSRRAGWFSSAGEGISDLMSIARPIKIGKSFFSVSIVGPVYRMKPQETRLAVQLATCCERILARLLRPSMQTGSK
jgi:DNA-binding IclR family transcriptional regulator